MNKTEFLNELSSRLSALPPEEVQKSLDYYSEIIDDLVEDGMTEEQAVAGLEDMDVIVQRIMQDTPLPTLIKAKAKRFGMSTVAIILGSPIWLSLGIAFLAVMIALYAALWSIVAALFAVVLAVGLSGIAMFAACIPAFAFGTGWGLMVLGAGFVLIALGIIFFFPALVAAKGLVKLMQAIWHAVKRIFMPRREAK